MKAWLVDEEVSVLGTNNSQNGEMHKNLLSALNGMNHKNFRPQKFEAIWYMVCLTPGLYLL